MPPRSSTLSRRELLAATVVVGAGLTVNGALPAFASERALSFFVIGDWGEDGEKGQKDVASAMIEKAASRHPDFIITVGDNFYSKGVDSVFDEHWRKSFEEVYDSPELQCPWYAVLGNHDWQGDVSAEIDFHAIDRRWNMPSPYYRIAPATESGTVEFFFLDTTPFRGGDAADAYIEKQVNWLASQLSKSSARWKIAVGHHPIFSSGTHTKANQLIETVQPLFEKYAVAAYFCGHDHHLEHTASRGIHYFVAGSGASTRPVDPRAVEENHPDFIADQLGFAAVTIDSDEMTVEYVSASGNILHHVSIPAKG